ncbi:chemotaxis-specific protein-glutamate methyltransferase CheB [uncultured Roseobacter sp.]|uniref:chemotaxis-specific protein-glutamate methyltransferase CheB n=1 Tax=uncultured Roseobacter sp. TaxID=114847 RepID=UPI0026069239|nr:chemotaxis-specific protein-glutamate methyltransferase CheB [uncultured Roseobacter sp.]
MTSPYLHGTPAGNPPTKQVLIVDDSRVMRAWLRAVLSADPRLEIAGEACDAIAARDFLKAQPVDVLTLDIEMPGMSGLEFLARLMRARPMPVVMMSSLTAAGSDAAIQALSRGAIDCMVKPSKSFGEELTQDICERVYHAACTRPSQLQMRIQSNALAAAQPNHAAHPAPRVTAAGPCAEGSIILLGASTGGVAALETVLPMLDPEGPPVVVVQHMPGNFLRSFSERLNRQMQQTVRLASEHKALERGEIVLAPGNQQHTELYRRAGHWYCHFIANDPPALHCPAVDKLFSSAVNDAKRVTAGLLTGLGRDGAEGLLKLAQAGASTFGQNEASCVVYGMPRAAKSIGAVQSELPLDQIGTAIREAAAKKTRSARMASRVQL